MGSKKHIADVVVPGETPYIRLVVTNCQKLVPCYVLPMMQCCLIEQFSLDNLFRDGNYYHTKYKRYHDVGVDEERVLLLRHDDRRQLSSIVNGGLHPSPQRAADRIDNNDVGTVFVVVVNAVTTTAGMATVAMDEG